MTEIHEHQHEQFYNGDRKLFSVDVDIDADANRDPETILVVLGVTGMIFFAGATALFLSV